MNRNGIGKAHISVSGIGAGRFWIGISIGLVTAISLGFFFSHSREVLRYITQLGADLLVLSPEDHWFFNYFYSALAVTLGLSVSVWVWLGNRIHKRKKDKRYKLFAMTLILMNFWFVLMVISRMGSVLPIILQSLHGYDNHLDFAVEFRRMFIAIPIVIFLLVWSSTRLIYKSLSWMAFSVPVCLVGIYALAHIVNVDQSVVNDSYFGYYEKQINYLDSEIKHANTVYGVGYDKQTIEVLKKWETESSINQMLAVNRAFKGDRPLSLDTIVLGKVILHNMKGGIWNGMRRHSIENWHYPQPVHVLKHLNSFEYDSNEAKELVDILNVQIRLWNCEDFDYSDWDNLTNYEHERIFFAEHKIPPPIIEQMRIVRDSLMNNADFVKYQYVLPEVVERER